MKQSVYQLRSNDESLLDFPCGKMLTSFGDRPFSVAAPTLWNTFTHSIIGNQKVRRLRKQPSFFTPGQSEGRLFSQAKRFVTVQQLKSLLKTYLVKLAFKNLI